MDASEATEIKWDEYSKTVQANQATVADTETFKGIHKGSIDDDRTYPTSQHTRRQATVSRSHTEDSFVRQRPPKRPRSELTAKSAILNGDIDGLGIDALEDLIADLQQGSRQLGSMQASVQPPCTYLTLHRLVNGRKKPIHLYSINFWTEQKESLALYLDPPPYTRGQSRQEVLRSQLPVTNFGLYLEQNKDISFVVFKHIRCLMIHLITKERDHNTQPFAI